MPERKIITMEGEVVTNPYGNWSDVDKGVYVGGEAFASCGGAWMTTVLTPLEGKRVRVTIEELPPEEATPEEA